MASAMASATAAGRETETAAAGAGPGTRPVGRSSRMAGGAGGQRARWRPDRHGRTWLGREESREDGDEDDKQTAANDPWQHSTHLFSTKNRNGQANTNKRSAWHGGPTRN